MVRQKALFDAGRSKVLTGKHNSVPSKAADVTPYPLPKWEHRVSLPGQLGTVTLTNRAPFDVFAGYVLGTAQHLGIKIRWGGDWDSDHDLFDQTFNDLVHFEVVN